MGWSFGHSRRADLIRDLTRNEDGEKATRTCVAHCYRGSAHRGVLWSVWSIVKKATGKETRFIGCDLLKYNKSMGPGYEWGYKDLRESMHPYYYSCPLKYLEMAPVACEEWREGVRKYHAEHNRKLEKGKVYHARKGLTVRGHGIDFILVKSLKPMRGLATTSEGLHWDNVRFKRAHLGELA